jgi:predicted Zn-dependent protease
MNRPMAAPRSSSLLRLAVIATAVTLLVTAVSAGSQGTADSPARQRFLSDWNTRADFYRSGDSKFGNFQITPAYELEMGRSVTISVTPSTDAEAQQFVAQVVDRVIKGSPADGVAASVQLVSSDNANALTVPGRMFISDRMLQYVNSEAELAAVAAHELGHLYGHHASRRLIKAARGKALVGFLGGALAGAGVRPNAQALAALAGNIGLDLYLKAFDRAEEFEADRFATHLLFNAGYDPSALPMVLQRLQAEHQQRPIPLLSTHPPMRDRLDDLRKYLASFPPVTTTVNAAAFDRAIKKVAAPGVPAAPPTAPAAVAPPPALSLPPVAPPLPSALPPVNRSPSRPSPSFESFIR